jgi:hypothetical protein
MNVLCTIPISLTTLFILGCAGAVAPRVLELRPLARGGFSGIQVARQEVIRDSRRWEETWNEHRGKSSAPCPPVDFSKEVVIVATMGRQNTGGYSIRVVRAEATADKLRIQISRTTPKAGARAIQVLTAPYDFVAVPRVELPVEFVDGPAQAGK